MEDTELIELELKYMLLETRISEITEILLSVITNMNEYVKENNLDKEALMKALFKRTKDVDKVLDILLNDYEARENERIDEFCKRYEKIQKYSM